MNSLVQKPDIDSENNIEKIIDGCKVRLFFCKENTDGVERAVLDNLLLAFDRKNQRLSNVGM